MIRRVWNLARSGSAQDSATYFLGNFANTTLSFIAVLIVSRHLGPASFGVVGVFNSIVVLIIGVTDLGLNTTSIRLISEYREQDPKKGAITMNVIVRLELMVGALILVVGAIFATRIANLVGGQHYLVAVRLGFVAGAFASVAAFFGPFFVSYRLYVKNALLNLSSFVARTGLILLLLATSALTLTKIMAVYTIVPLLFLVVGFYFIPRDFLIPTNRPQRSKAYRDVFHYSKWIFLSMVATGVISRLDILFIARYQGSQQTGYYYAAQQLIAIMPLVVAALSTVLLQRISQLKSSQYRTYLRRAFGAIVLLEVALLPVLLLAPFGFHLIFGAAFTQAAAPFRLLFISQLVTLLTIPLSVWFLRIGQPRKITVATAGQFATSLVLYIILIPRYGLIGASSAVLAGSVVAAGFLLGFAKLVAAGDGDQPEMVLK